jgi:4a-hydroxytetrahydrobiopterin dehydratase
MSEVLSDDAIQKKLAALPGWSVQDGKLHKDLRFKDFNEAFGFMARVALVAEQRNHHPEWSNVWNTVVIDVVSHSAGGITDQCVDLCTAIESIYNAGARSDFSA